MKRKMLAASLALCILFTAIATGCQKKEEVNSSSVPQVGDTPNDAPVSIEDYQPKTDKITLLTTNRAVPEGNSTQKWLEENLKVKLEAIVLNGDDLKTKLNLLSASNALPDLMTIPNSYTADYLNLAKQGMLADLEPLIKDYGPNIQACRTPESIDSLRDKDGKIYAINSNKETDFDMALIRTDWLKNVNKEIPTTVDELLDVVRAFAKDDPDGNGQNDTYGYFAWQEGNPFNIIYAAFGANPDQWVWKGGKLVYGAAQPEMKDALQFIQAMYNEKLINGEYLTADRAKANEVVSTGKAGIIRDQLWYTNPEYSVYHQSKGAEWTAIPKVKSDKHEGGYLTLGNPQVRQFTCISAKSKDPIVAMLYLNFIADSENLLRIRAGVEGEHYDLANNLVVTKPEYLKDNSLLIQEGITATYAMPFFSADPHPMTQIPSCFDLLRVRRENEIQLYGGMYWPVPEIVDQQLNSGMKDYIGLTLNSLIMGKGDVSTELDKMSETLYAKYHLEKQEIAANKYAEEMGFKAP